MNTDKDIEIALRDVKEKFETVGKAFFDQYEHARERLTAISRHIIIEKGIPSSYRTYGFRTVTRTIYLLAIYQYQIGNIEIARKLSELGKSSITGPSGSGLLPYFESMMEGNFA